MRRLYVALVILVLIFSAALYNAHFLEQVTGDITGLLSRAEARAEAGDWNSARKLTEQADAIWQDHSLYFHVFLRHSETDEIEIQLQEVQGFLQLEEQGEYSAANARLLAGLSILCEGEQFSLKNIL